MIGYVLAQELGNAMAGREVATVLTQVVEPTTRRSTPDEADRPTYADRGPPALRAGRAGRSRDGGPGVASSPRPSPGRSSNSKRSAPARRRGRRDLRGRRRRARGPRAGRIAGRGRGGRGQGPHGGVARHQAPRGRATAAHRRRRRARRPWLATERVSRRPRPTSCAPSPAGGVDGAQGRSGGALRRGHRGTGGHRTPRGRAPCSRAAPAPDPLRVASVVPTDAIGEGPGCQRAAGSARWCRWHATLIPTTTPCASSWPGPEWAASRRWSRCGASSGAAWP